MVFEVRVGELQWNLDLTRCQGTGQIGSLYRGFVISRLFFIHYAITGLKISFVVPRTSLYRGSLNRGYTGLEMSQVNEDTTTKWCVSTSVYCWVDVALPQG